MNKARTLFALLGTLVAASVISAPAAIAAAPAVTIDPASSLTSTTAAFSGNVTTTSADPTTCNFEYITDAAYQPRDEVKRIVVKAIGGTFVILIEAPKNPSGVEETIPLPYDAEASEVEAALQALTVIGPGGVIVSGDATGSVPYLLTFPGQDAGAFFADGGSPTHPGVTKITTSNPGGPSSDEVQELAVKASTGTFTLSFESQTTAPIPYNASAADIQSALEALSTIGAGNIAVSGGPGDVSASTPYTLTFAGSLAATDVPSLQSDAGQLVVLSPPLIGPGKATTKTTSAGNPTSDEVQQLSVNANAGTFTLSFEGESTAPIPFNASAAEVQSALEALSTIGAGNLKVTGSYDLEFQGTLGSANVPLVEADGSNLTSASASAEGETVTEGHAEGFGGSQTAPCDPPNPIEAEGNNPATASAAGLEPGTLYHLRLVAGNSEGSGEAATTFATEAAAPQIEATSFSGVTSSAATLKAQINPGGAPTTYRFEYLTLEAFEEAGESFAGATKTPEANLSGADNQAHEASANITGLQAGTAYRFRVVATNEMAPGSVAGLTIDFKTLPSTGSESCSNAAVRSQQGSTYLPECRAYEIVSKPGLDLGDANRVPYTSDDGEHVAYISIAPGDEALGGGVASITVAHRSPTGWIRTSADPASVGYSDGSTGFTDPKGFSPDFSQALYSVVLPLSGADADGQGDVYRVDVGSGTSTLLSQKEDIAPTFIAGASPDFERVVFSGSSGGLAGLWESDGTQRELLTLYPNNEPVGLGLGLTASSQSNRGVNVGGVGGGSASPFVERGGAHGISDDARRVYFIEFGSGKLYVRDLVSNPAQTVAVGVSSRTSSKGTQFPVQFISATHDGSIAYFHSTAQLTDAATQGGGFYRFDLATQSVAQVSPDASPGGFDLNGAIASDDQSHIYFTSTAALAGAAQAGDVNAYVWTAADGFRFIARVDNGNALMRVTPNGRFALLGTGASINGAPNDGHFALYEYDYETEQVACVSCRPDGSPSQGDAAIDNQSYGEPGAMLTRSRALTFDGRVFFDSTDRVVAADQTAAQDVYVYDKGTVGLISSGREITNSYLMDNSDDGKHVFFVTRAPLVGADRDPAEYDAYDAYVDGGFLEATSSAPCEGEACRGGVSTSPVAATPTTPSLAGPGNPRPCGKGKIRRNGRCEKPRKHRKKHAGKHKNQKRDANTNGRPGR